MDLPLLVAGPILRRVEPTLVSVWVALTEPCNVVLQTWEGRAETGRPTPLAESPATPTLRVGAKLHLVEVTVQIPETAGVSFQPDALYSYDVQITPNAVRHHAHAATRCTCSRRGSSTGSRGCRSGSSQACCRASRRRRRS